MAHYQTQPYMRTSSTLSTAERGGQRKYREENAELQQQHHSAHHRQQQQQTTHSYSNSGPSPSSSPYASPYASPHASPAQPAPQSRSAVSSMNSMNATSSSAYNAGGNFGQSKQQQQKKYAMNRSQSHVNRNGYDNDNGKYGRRKQNRGRLSSSSSSSSRISYLVPIAILTVLVLGLVIISVRDNSHDTAKEEALGNRDQRSLAAEIPLQSKGGSSNPGTSVSVSSSSSSSHSIIERDNQNSEEEERESSLLRGGMTKHERAAAALLLADIIVHAEHEIEEEMATSKVGQTRADAGRFSGFPLSNHRSYRLGENDDDYFLIAKDVAGAGYAYLPYEIDALDCKAFAVSVWVKLDVPSGSNGRQQGNRVIWSTLPPGACGSSSPRAAGNNLHDDVAGMELSIDGDMVKVSYVASNGSCDSVRTLQDRLPYGDWNHVGMIVTDERIGIYQNGSSVGMTATSTAGRTTVRRAKHSHIHPIEPPSHRPKGRMMRTIVGQRKDGSDVLNGRVGLLSIYAVAASDRLLVGDDIMKAAYELGKRNDSGDGPFATSNGEGREPTYFYPFEGESVEGVKTDAASTSKETSKGRHATVRRHVPVQQYTQSSTRRYAEYASGTNKPVINPRIKTASDDLARLRRIHVRNAFRHAWEGYRTEAWGYDELLPVSGGTKDNWGGMATTLVDSLSTLWLLNMTDEFNEARDWVRNELTFDAVGAVSVFETTIRSLGGLLSAYDLSGDKVFLDKADDLGSRLLKAFDSPSGLPFGEAVLNGDRAYNTEWHPDTAILSELGTMQLEFRYLSRATGKKEYAKKVLQVIDTMERMQLPNGLYYLYVKNVERFPKYGNQKISFGAMGDSFYEYLLKLWLQGGKKETKYRRMYDMAMDGMHNLLVKKNDASGLTYVSEMERGTVEDKQDHLSCYVAGNLALGAYTHPDGLDSETAQRDLRTAKSIAYTCYQMYRQSQTGIAPEAIWFGKHGLEKRKHAVYYILRPETAESFYILYTLTGDPAYREWGWEMFLSILQYCKTDLAFGSLKDVDNAHLPIDDKMESFFLAETLKYLYLLQDPDTDINVLEKHVFNTEAHPLRIQTSGTTSTW